MDKPRDYLKALRTERNLTTQEVAEAIGISKQYYSMIETGISQKRMDLTLVRRIADFFGVSIEWVAEQEKQLEETGEETKD